MAHSPKRISRKALRRPDQFVTFTGKIFDFFRAHRTAALASLAGLLSLLVMFGAWDLYQSRRQRLAAEQYSRALNLFYDEKYREAIEVFDGLSRSAPPPYRVLALLYLANSHLALGEPTKAIPPLEQVTQHPPRPDYLRQLAFLSLGYAREKTGDFTQAAASFAAAERIPGPFKEQSLLGRARAHAHSGDNQAALEAYRSYLENFPLGASASQITLRIQELEAKVGKIGKLGAGK